MELTYKLIEPIIKKEEITGNTINLEFCAKNQEQPTSTVAVIMADTNKIKKTVAKQAIKGAVKNSILNQIMNLIGLRGFGRSIVNSATRDLMNKNQNPTNLIATEITPENIEKAIVDAFKGFVSMYKYNEQSLEWEYNMPSV